MDQSKNHLPFLDGIRGVAILAVFLFHSLGASYGYDKLPWKGMFRNFDADHSFLVLYPVTYGYLGVAVFFVVSGFCIHLSHIRSKEKGWLCFYNRRFFRLYPAYLLALLIFAFVRPWGNLSLDFEKFTQFVAHMLLAHNFSDFTSFGINASFWSIAVEVQLYFLYPLLVWMARKRGWEMSLAIVFLVEVTLRLSYGILDFIGQTPPRIFLLNPFIYVFSWSIGAYLAQCYTEGRESIFSRIRFDVAAAVIIFLSLFRPTAQFSFLGFSLLSAIAMDCFICKSWSVSKYKISQKVWSHLGFLGMISYSFYLYHQPLISVALRSFGRFFPHAANPVMKFSWCCCSYLGILFISYISFRFVEQPSVRFGRNVWTKLSGGRNSGG